jgi:hypothetical protein
MIVRDESPDGHGLHGMVGDADRAVDNAARDAEITRACALNFVVGFSMTYSRRQLLANAAISLACRSIAVGPAARISCAMSQ